MKRIILFVALLSLAFAQRRDDYESDYLDDDYESEERLSSEEQDYYCDELYGYFPHDEYCDKYWACENGTATLKECGNGLMFDSRDNRVESCNYDYIVPCGNRRKKAEPITTQHCDWLYGVFPDKDDCTIFWSCWNGVASKYECAAGLAYDSKNRICTWSHEIKSCKKRDDIADGFVCEHQDDSTSSFGHYTRHPHPTDCRKFFVCVSGKPRALGCERGQVFSSEILQCKRAKLVPGCEDYYKRRRTEEDDDDFESDYDIEDEDSEYQDF